MHQLKYKITSLAPLLISARYGDMNMVRTLQYIPGTSVLGMLAARYIKQKKINENAHLNDEFHSLFLKGDIRFGNAYIALTYEERKEFIYYPIPFSIQEEKRGKQIYDLLMMDEDGEGPDKQTITKAGFCRLEEDYIGFAEIKTNLNFHHARDPQTGTSKEGQIFNYESIAKGQVFHGVIIGGSEKLEKLIDACGRSWTGYIGRSKNAQYGKVYFEVLDQTPNPVCSQIKAKGQISLTFLSDTILYYENGFASTDINVLEKHLDLKIKKAFIRQDDAETFVGIWRFKKPSEACFKAGSCFLLENVTEAGRAKLEDLQKTGIGERTHEGFGQFVVGWQVDDKLNEDLKTSKFQKPDGEIPQKTKDILKTLIQNAIQKQMSLDAMREVNLFKPGKNNKLPSNSLIGRLHAMAEQLDKDVFINSINNSLRKISRDQLISCRSKELNQTLLDFLKSKSVSANDAFRNPELVDLKTLCQEIGYSPENDTELEKFENKLLHIYFTTFFSMMRKATKKKEGQNG